MTQMFPKQDLHFREENTLWTTTFLSAHSWALAPLNNQTVCLRRIELEKEQSPYEL